VVNECKNVMSRRCLLIITSVIMCKVEKQNCYLKNISIEYDNNGNCVLKNVFLINFTFLHCLFDTNIKRSIQ